MGITQYQISKYRPLITVESNNKFSNGVGGQSLALMFVHPLAALHEMGITYPVCTGSLKEDCQYCKVEAQSKPNSRWGKEGKKNYMSCLNRLFNERKQAELQAPSPVVAPEPQNTTVQQPQNTTTQQPSPPIEKTTGLDANTKKILIIGGGIAFVGLATILILKK